MFYAKIQGLKIPSVCTMEDPSLATGIDLMGRRHQNPVQPGLGGRRQCLPGIAFIPVDHPLYPYSQQAVPELSDRIKSKGFAIGQEKVFGQAFVYRLLCI